MNITVNSVHPGLIMTNLMRHSAILMSESSRLISGLQYFVLIPLRNIWPQGYSKSSPVCSGRTSHRYPSHQSPCLEQ